MLKKYADLHCDTLWRCFEQRRDLSHPALQVRVDTSFTHLQTYAIFIPDTVEDSLDYFRRVYDHGKKLLDANGRYVQCNCAKDIEKAINEGKKPYLISIEGGFLFGGSYLENRAVVAELKEKGVAFCSLCYNSGNKLAGGAMNSEAGLSEAGRAAAELLRGYGISLDISHLNRRSIDDILTLLNDGVVATHSNCYSLVPHPRNLRDDQIKELIKKNGMIGLNFYPPFLTGKEAASSDILHHLSYLEQLGAQNIIAFGSDFDGIEFTPYDLCSTDDLPAFYEKLCEKTDGRADQYCFGNVMQYLNCYFK